MTPLMLHTLSRPFVLVVFLSLLAAGCGGGAIPKGKVTKGGQPIKVSDKGMVQVRFIPAEGKADNVYSAKVEADGTFELKGNHNKPIPLGKYKIAVLAMDPYPTKDLLDGKFNEQKTTIVRDVTGSGSIDIDVDKP
jgi:hypothetical protein